MRKNKLTQKELQVAIGAAKNWPAGTSDTIWAIKKSDKKRLWIPELPNYDSTEVIY